MTVPPIIGRLLNRLRTRERLLALSWAAARVLAICAAALVLACLIDWWIDLRRDTPLPLRWMLLGLLLVLWTVLPLGWLAALFLTRKSDDQVALEIEDKVPSLGHRLISALQLNRKGARVTGMSPDLITAVTRQAEEQAATVDLAQVCDGRRFRWAALLAGGVALALGTLYVTAPQTCQALLSRLFRDEGEIPRRVSLEASNAEVWPAGEEGVLRFVVTGNPRKDRVGEARITPSEGPPLRFQLKHEKDDVWAARVPPADVPFTYLAWLGDGRLHQPGSVRYEPRPVVQTVQASVLLPSELLGKRPTGEPYEEAQRGGDIEYRLAGCKAQVRIATQVPIVSGEVRIQGRNPRQVPLTLDAQSGFAVAEFEMHTEDRSYLVTVRGRHRFENNDPPRRSIRRLPIEPPEVALLPEAFWKEGDTGTPEDREVEGIPVLLGERFALAYAAKARYGLSHAQLRFRVLPKSVGIDEESGRVDLDKFLPLPLGPGRGAKPPFSAQLRAEFSTRPAASSDALPDTEGGGRYDFQSGGIPDGKGGLLDLKEGDRIQFFVEVFGKADPDGVSGRSAVREKEVVDVKAYLAWLQKKEDLKERTRLLEEQQRAARPGMSNR